MEPYPLVPLNTEARRWTTVDTTHAVLLIAHNITTLSRILDVIDVFDGDPRIQLTFTSTESDPFRRELSEEIAKTGIVTIPWQQAKATKFDLAITASHHDNVGEITSPLVILSHGIGYTKYLHREPRAVFGLSPEWVLRDGKPAAQALVLSHSDQLKQLSLSAPAAVPAAVVAGDPCFDRILASLPFRDRYRDALGIGDRSLVYVSSTWSQDSALGTRFDLLRDLLAELPRDSYAIATALHPNITHRHGPGQVRRWFADCLRAGLIILSEIDDWRTGLIAADLVIGDNGSVTGYGAAIGRPTLLSAFPDVPDGTPIAELGRSAPRLPARGPVTGPIENALAEHDSQQFAAVADQVTSLPGQAHERLRDLFYEILSLTLPLTETPSVVLLAPTPPPHRSQTADRVTVHVDSGARLIQLVRRPAELQRDNAARYLPAAGGHLCCTTDYPMRTMRERADVLIGRTVDTNGDESAWLQKSLRDNPFCIVAATVDGGRCQALTRSGEFVTLSTDGSADALPSLVYAWFETGRPMAALAPSITAEVGRSRHQITVWPG